MCQIGGSTGIISQVAATLSGVAPLCSTRCSVDDSNDSDVVLLLLLLFGFLSVAPNKCSPATPCWTRSSQEGGIKEWYLRYVVPLALRLALGGSVLAWLGVLTRCVVVSFGQTKEKVHVICDIEFDPWVRSSSHPTSAHPIRIRIRKFGCGWVFTDADADADGCIIRSDDVVIRKIQSVCRIFNGYQGVY
ncbi:hypothetical protein BDC45DRAFT_562742 [Circinella umbellata]|nr:hypothetical protein BDC45DRAFT_562742 [Circinella umbellata]